MSHPGTSNYPPTFLSTPNFTPRHLQLPTHFPHHSQCHTLAPLITPPIYRSLLISYLGTSHYPPNFITTPNFTPRHIRLPTHFPHKSQFPTWAPSITLPLSPHFNFHSWAPPITHPISPPLLISHPGTSDYPPIFLTTSNLTPGHLRSPPHFPHHFQLHTWAPPITHPISPPLLISHPGTSNYPPIFLTTSNLTPGHLQSPTHFPHHFQFQTWVPPITHPLSPPLRISHMGTSDHPPNLLITSNFLPRHLPLPTQFHHHSQFPTWTPSITLSLSHHFNFHTWAPPITYHISPPLPMSHLGTSNDQPTFLTTSNLTLGHL